MKNTIRLTTAVLLTTALACDPPPKESNNDDTLKAVGIDSIMNATNDSTATSIQSDSIPVSE